MTSGSQLQLAALSRSTPGGLSYGTVGSGGLMQFAAEIFRVKTDSKFTSVPYRGGTLATSAVVSGEVHGDGEIDGGLNLSATGTWNGFIQAQQAIVAGKITGGLFVRDRLEIGYTAVIHGKVSARTIAIAKGAIVDGEIEVVAR